VSNKDQQNATASRMTLQQGPYQAGRARAIGRLGVALLEDMRNRSKTSMAKTRKDRTVSRDTTIPETPDVRACMALDAMKDESPI